MTVHPYSELKQKLTLLKTEQRKLQRRYLYRALWVSSVAGSIIALAFSNFWEITDSSQIAIYGARFADTATISQLIDLPYPQSIINVPTQNIEARLRSISALRSVRVGKTIFPPSVGVYIEERIPVATAISRGKIGFLDREGNWLKPDMYDYQQSDFPASAIKVINFKPQYSAIWSEIYSLIVAYPQLKIVEIQWDDGGNLILLGDKFKVLLGANPSLLEKQFVALANFADLASSDRVKDILLIDLTNPEIPLLESNSTK